jgi:hypothetical protein
MLKMVSCNINDKVKFKLTPYGKSVLETHLKSQRDQYGVDAHELYKSDCCGDIRLHLHDFMTVFGKYCVMGGQQIIEKNELVFVGE